MKKDQLLVYYFPEMTENSYGDTNLTHFSCPNCHSGIRVPAGCVSSKALTETTDSPPSTKRKRRSERKEGKEEEKIHLWHAQKKSNIAEKNHF